MAELRALAIGLSPEQAGFFLTSIRKMTDARHLNTRVALLRLLAVLAQTYPAVACRHVDALVAFLVERAHDPESAIREACVSAMGALAVHLLPLLPTAVEGEVDAARLLNPLLSVMSEQSPASQECAGQCIAALASPQPPPLTLTVATDARSVDEAREILTRHNNGSAADLPRNGLQLLPDGRLLLDFPTSSDARRFHAARGEPGALPGHWALAEFPEAAAQQAADTWQAYVRCLGNFTPRLLHGVLSLLKARSGVRPPLFQTLTNLAAMASTQAEGQAIGQALALATAPIAERLVSVLSDKRKEGWKDKTAAAGVVVALSSVYDCGPALAEVKPALAAALALNRFDQIKQVCAHARIGG
jgi:hypothetical protein